MRTLDRKTRPSPFSEKRRLHTLCSGGYLLLILALVADAEAFSNSPTPTFAEQKIFSAGSGPEVVLAADFNGDGKPDVAVTNSGARTASVLLNTTARASLKFAPERTFYTTAAGFYGAVGDINGDGKPDLVIPDWGGYNVSVMVNTTARGVSTPTFAEPQTTPAGTGLFDVTIMDVNQDGKPDIAVGESEAIVVLLNTTLPEAATVSFAPPQSVSALDVIVATMSTADINGDGKADLVASVGNGVLAVFLNTTRRGASVPTFAPAQTFMTESSASAIVVADINQDGKPDIAVAYGYEGTISVLLNTTDPGAATATLAQQQVFPAAFGPMTAADINQDGKPDLIIADYLFGGVTALLNLTEPGATAATFVAQGVGQTGINPSAITTAYINDDEKPDIVVANYSDSTVSVLLNTTPQRRHAYAPWP